jgi:tetratricopeptide (TPR) repeat protein
MGRAREGVAQVKTAEELDPLALPVKVAKGWCLCLTKQYEASIDELRKVLEMDARFGTAHQVIGWAYALNGEGAEAVKHLRLIGGEPASPAIYRSSLAHALVIAGQRDEAMEIVRELECGRARRYVSGVQMASVFAAAGEPDAAFAWLEEAVGQRDRPLAMLRCDARLDPLRGDPRFRQIEAMVRLPPGQAEQG